MGLRKRRTAVMALCAVPVLGFAFGAFLAFNLPGDDTGRDDATEAFGGGAPAAQVAPTPSPGADGSPPPTARTAGLVTATPRASLRPRDRVAPAIGQASSQYGGIWTDFWCSAGPTISEIEIPVADPTDPATALTVNVQFVLHREDKVTVDLDTRDVSSASSPFVMKIGPYPGPNEKYTYSNVLDMVVTATDRAGNKATRTFAGFMTFNDCKA